ncbi:predicted protein [Lichtheimia corymbifera JMRC:FSU:9682]|uniref:Uncharacterized protein n=1 Tax=Lichtheimia corymbifera JMRC:FSU:9682 TaxID=1263082 RepID=A0A068S9Z0_9FUNG|nr:predicted protein [Lichtheimia corymbifera JMRC:FSU:9682]
MGLLMRNASLINTRCLYFQACRQGQLNSFRSNVQVWMSSIWKTRLAIAKKGVAIPISMDINATMPGNQLIFWEVVDFNRWCSFPWYHPLLCEVFRSML